MLVLPQEFSAHEVQKAISETIQNWTHVHTDFFTHNGRYYQLKVLTFPPESSSIRQEEIDINLRLK
jgi:hypothetical protein